MSKIYTTLNKIREHHPCESSWVKLLESLDKTKADDEPLAMTYILDLLGMGDTFWAMRSLPEYDKVWCHLACEFATRVLPLYEAEYPDDGRPRKAIEMARKYALGEATEEELSVARSAAWDAAGDAAGDAAWAAAWAAARSVARSAAWDAAWAAWVAAGDAAWAARDAEANHQKRRLREVLETCGDGWVERDRLNRELEDDHETT